MMKWLILLAGIVLAGSYILTCAASEAPAKAETAVFAVRGYDVGAAALEGRPGVISVEKGWQGVNEINRVVYDPKIVSIEQMEEWLRGAGTYIRTVQRPDQSKK